MSSNIDNLQKTCNIILNSVWDIVIFYLVSWFSFGWHMSIYAFLSKNIFCFLHQQVR